MNDKAHDLPINNLPDLNLNYFGLIQYLHLIHAATMNNTLLLQYEHLQSLIIFFFPEFSQCERSFFAMLS